MEKDSLLKQHFNLVNITLKIMVFKTSCPPSTSGMGPVRVSSCAPRHPGDFTLNTRHCHSDHKPASPPGPRAEGYILLLSVSPDR